VDVDDLLKMCLSSMNIPINEEYDDLSTLYWISKLHRNPYRERYITSPSTEAQSTVYDAGFTMIP
jgi:hypothetical protein